MADVRDIVTEALRELGVLSAGEVATADDVNFGFDAFNRLIDQWAAERLQVYQTVRTVWAIVSGTQTYTLGTGGTINVARPVFVNDIRVQDTAPTLPTEYSLDCLTDDAWSRVNVKTQTSVMPSAFYYNPTYPLGTVTLWPIPTSATLQGVLYAPQAVAEFATLATTVALPPGYRRMFVKNLALDLAPSYGKQVGKELADAASDSVAVVKRSNKRLLDMSIEASALIQGSGRFAYDINSGP